MTSLQLGLIVAGIVLVVGVLIYNWWQERRVRGRIDAAFRSTTGSSDALLTRADTTTMTNRVEPTLGDDETSGPMLTRAAPAAPMKETRVSIDDLDDVASEAPLPVQVRASALASDPLVEVSEHVLPPEPPAPAPARVVHEDAHGAQPDPDIECIVALHPTKPVAARVLAQGLQTRLGKRLRWFGRRGISMPWQLLARDTAGEFAEITVCLLLADRTGAASVPMLESFARLVADLAPDLPAAFVAPDVPREAARAETLDRICADLDVQIGLTLLKETPGMITGTRLRGVAEAAGFRLSGERFEWVQEETGAVLYALQNFRADPFTPDTLRSTSTPGVVFLLDVPRVADPVRVFDHMKVAAKRMAQTLDAALVDDNRRVLDDAALLSIRQQIQTTANGLQAVNIEPGSPRAMALFGG